MNGAYFVSPSGLFKLVTPFEVICIKDIRDIKDEVRWDFNNDGIWDSEFYHKGNVVCNYPYELYEPNNTTWNIRTEVKRKYSGHTRIIEQSFEVNPAPYGPDLILEDEIQFFETYPNIGWGEPTGSATPIDEWTIIKDDTLNLGPSLSPFAYLHVVGKFDSIFFIIKVGEEILDEGVFRQRCQHQNICCPNLYGIGCNSVGSSFKPQEAGIYNISVSVWTHDHELNYNNNVAYGSIVARE